MASYVISCPKCGKPVIIDPSVIAFSCPYCRESIDAAAQRESLLVLEAEAKKTGIRERMEEGDNDQARDAALEAASVSEKKTPFFALMLECDLLRHHPFFFDHRAIDADVEGLLSAKDFAELPADEMEKTRASSLQALGLFREKTFEHLNHHHAFVGERFDAVTRFAYVGMCCLAIKKIGAKPESLAKECVHVISDICSGSFGEVYNMPPEIFQEAKHVVESLAHEFRFAASVRLQSNPHTAERPKKEKFICPICGETLPKSAKGQFMTCPACRHRVSTKAIQNVSLCAEPTSYQDKLERCIAEDNLQGAKEALLFLRKKDPSNPNYAMAELVIRRADITPLRLGLEGYPELLRLASSANAEALQKQLRNTADHFSAIRSILSEASSLPHGPSKELIDTLDEFLRRFA